MSQSSNVIFLGLGVTIASVAAVAAFLWYETPAAEDDVVAVGEGVPADQIMPAKVSSSDYRTLEGDLKVADLVVGTGPEPVAGQVLKVHYSGWLADGYKLFDSSTTRGKPIEFQFQNGGVIDGWQKGIAGMKAGGKRQLVIPPDLAYGASGRPPVIPPSSTLIFDLELVELGEIRKVPDLPTIDWNTATVADKGVRFADIEPGTGTAAMERSVIEGELTVWKQDGSVFFSSWSEGRPVSFLVGGEGAEAAPLEGIDIAVRGAMAGASRVAQLPPDAAFGEQGFRDQIPPNSTVTVQLDILKVSAPRVSPDRKPTVAAGELTTTESGLQYKDLVVGDGASPAAGDMVFAEYSGWLDNGTLFDSSYKRKAAFSFPLGRGAVIQAWDEALSTMKVGGKRLIVAPPDLAYGENGKGDIPPGSTLTFEIELVDVKSRH